MVTTVRLLAFAGARDAIGAPEVELRLPERATLATGASDGVGDGVGDPRPRLTVEELLGHVCEQFPALAAWRGCLRLAVNGAYAAPTDAVRGGDEVAIIPPVAGG